MDLQTEKVTCSVEGCDEDLYCKGICKLHYSQKRRGRPFTPRIVPILVCSFNGCERPHAAKGLCPTHYYQLTRRGETWPIGTARPNRVEIKGDHAEVIVFDRKGNEVARALIDVGDIELTRPYRWNFNRKSRYFTAHIRGNQKACLYMHRLILGEVVGGDHISGNRLDNRRSNLRPATQSENCQNVVRPGREHLRNIYRDGRSYRVMVQKDRKQHSVCGIRTLEDAQRIAREMRAMYFTHHNEERHATA